MSLPAFPGRGITSASQPRAPLFRGSFEWLICLLIGGVAIASQIGRGAATSRDAPPYWIDVTAKTVLDNPVAGVVADSELARPGTDAHSLAYTATRLGVTSRRAACEAFGESCVGGLGSSSRRASSTTGAAT